MKNIHVYLASLGPLLGKTSHVQPHNVGTALPVCRDSLAQGLMMIAFITIKSSLVPLIEGLCAQIYLSVYIFC